MLTFPTSASAQQTLAAEAAVDLGLRQSPAVRAAEARVEAARAGLRGAASPLNPRAELAPGVGFTNGNSLLSQQLDVGGLRRAQREAARGELATAAALLEATRRDVAAEIRTAYFDLARAQRSEEAARDTAALAARIRDLVQRRVEIGEAPKVQAVRAGIEAARAEQEAALARGDARARLAALNILLDRDPAAPAVTEGLRLPAAPGGTPALVERALAARPELSAGRGLVATRQGEVGLARAQRRPQLFAEAAADVWSLDRDPFQSRNLGFQARLSFPLFDRGSLRAGVDRARARVREQEAELVAAERLVRLEVERAAAELAAARDVAAGYEGSILPQSEGLLAATQSGFEAGLTSFLEVLEAQRTLRQVREEYLTALFEAVRARIRLDRAVGEPGASGGGTPR